MPYFSKNYKRYDLGTSQLATSADPISGALLGITRSIGAGIDAAAPAGSYGERSPLASAASTLFKNPGVLGVPLAAASFFGQRARNKAATNQRLWDQQRIDDMNRKQSQAVLANDPELATGTVGASYFAKGGMLARNYLANSQAAEGGSLTPLNDEAVEVNGPSHEEGGVQLPGSEAEVEGGETMQGNFVFSERLGFAREHKRIAKSIGAIEEKGPMTPERVNSVKRLKDREQKLALSQEYLKHTMQHFGQPLQS